MARAATSQAVACSPLVVSDDPTCLSYSIPIRQGQGRRSSRVDGIVDRMREGSCASRKHVPYNMHFILQAAAADIVCQIVQIDTFYKLFFFGIALAFTRLQHKMHKVSSCEATCNRNGFAQFGSKLIAGDGWW